MNTDAEAPTPLRRKWLRRIALFSLLLLCLAGGCGLALTYFLRAQNAAFVSRVRSDMRSFATAVDAYYADHRAWPAMRPAAELIEPWGGGSGVGDPLTGFAPYMSIEPGSSSIAGLTTPVSYITQLIYDPFHKARGAPFGYYTDGTSWVVYSAGPNGEHDFNPATDFDGGTSWPMPGVIAKEYDPTNGLSGRGDLIRVGWKPGESPFDR